MKRITDIINEAKFSNFNPQELKEFADKLKELKDGDKSKYVKTIKTNRDQSGMYYKHYALTNITPKRDKIVYGDTYLLIFNNPFTNAYQLCKKYEDAGDLDSVKLEPLFPDEDDVIWCLAVADKFEKLHLVNQWESDTTVTYKDKGLYMHKPSQHGEESFYSASGFYLYRKNIPCYYVWQDYKNRDYNNFEYVYSEKQKNAYVRLQNCYCINLKTIDKFEEDQKQKAEKERIANERIARQNALEARRKELREICIKENYKNLGWMQDWPDKMPDLYLKAKFDKSEEFELVQNEWTHKYKTCYTLYSHKYKFFINLV